MSHWGYRLMRWEDPNGTCGVAVHEVHFREGEIVAWTEEPAKFIETDAETLKKSLRNALLCCDLPVIDGHVKCG